MSKTNTFNVIDKKLTIDQRGTFIDRVVNSCFNGTNFRVEILEPVFEITVMQMMTDKPLITEKSIVHNDETGEDNEIDVINYNATYEMIENEKVIEQVKDVFDRKYIGYLNQLHSDVIESLEYKKAQMIAMTSPLSSLLASVKNAVDNMDMSKAKDIIEMATKMNNAGLNDSGKIIDAIVKNLSKNDDKNVQNVLANEQKDVK
jgi:type VI protein secretion system component VasK